MQNRNLIDYNGFQIGPVTFEIYRAGRPVFTAWWQRCHTLEQAQITINASNKAKKLPDKGAALRKLMECEEFENGEERREYEEKQINNYYENQLYESTNSL